MTTKYIKRLATAAMALIMLTACSTTRKAAKTSNIGSTANTAAEYAMKVTDNFQKSSCLTAKTNMLLQSGNRNLTLSGSLKMKRNDVIQMSMTFLGMEVARFEFTPDYVLLIDRFDKQYVQTTYSDASFLRSASLDFYTLQSMFWNEIFVPGVRDVRTSLGNFKMSSSGSHTLLSLTTSPKLDYEFLTVTASALLDRVTVLPKNATSAESLTCKYADFTSFGGKQFPTEISLIGKGGKRDINLTISLSRLSNSDKWQTRTKVPSSYKRRSIDEVMKTLSNIQ